jgi:tetratricopeptide (TPR) repeat protein
MGPAAALVLIVGLNAAALRLFPPAAAPVRTPHLDAENAVRDVSLIALGMRRLAADVKFVEMLVYYGSPEERENPFEYLHSYYFEGAGGHRHIHEGGVYPELAPRALRVLELDPRFSYAALYAAGALAFNLQRPDEAVSLLTQARLFDPRDWRYPFYIAAIGFHKQGDGERVLSELAPVLSDPECPTMLKNMAAFLDVRLNHIPQAVRLYRQILESRDTAYRTAARDALEKLGERP